MRMRLLLAALVVVISGVGAGTARADQPDVSLAGKPFYFSATCTGLGDIVLVNQSLARTAERCAWSREGCERRVHDHRRGLLPRDDRAVRGAVQLPRVHSRQVGQQARGLS
jgi:hypothetical protein